MPRIGGGGGGGPVIPPQTPGQGPQTPKSDFASKLNPLQTQGSDSARTQQAKQTRQSQLTGKAREIAKRLRRGDIDQKTATREFVGLVIEERFPQFKKRKKRKKEEESSPEEELEEAVTELIDQDPVLATRLSSQFDKLAAKE